MEDTKYEAIPMTDMSAKNLEETNLEEIVDTRGLDSYKRNIEENISSAASFPLIEDDEIQEIDDSRGLDSGKINTHENLISVVDDDE